MSQNNQQYSFLPDQVPVYQRSSSSMNNPEQQIPMCQIGQYPTNLPSYQVSSHSSGDTPPEQKSNSDTKPTIICTSNNTSWTRWKYFLSAIAPHVLQIYIICGTIGCMIGASGTIADSMRSYRKCSYDPIWLLSTSSKFLRQLYYVCVEGIKGGVLGTVFGLMFPFNVVGYFLYCREH